MVKLKTRVTNKVEMEPLFAGMHALASWASEHLTKMLLPHGSSSSNENENQSIS